jgi:serine/threonine protein kinase/tetratricopeptide (TPR) repeat protein
MMKCPKCQADNPETVKFCGECGTLLPPLKHHPPVVTEILQTPVNELTTGSTFAGRYQVIEELGHGGMGRVYKVFDTDIKEKIALKLLRPEIALDKETVERFSNELKLARKISHRNVCRMFDLGKAEGMTFITMEFVAGEDLKKLIRKTGQLGAGRAVSIAKQVSEGLAEAHHLSIVHRDLKPQNIMVDEDGNARIMDFGIARSLKVKGITGAGVMIGTPEYMSPEQVEGKEVDQRSDIYSLGIILYEMVAGRVPFEGDTPFTIGVKHKCDLPRDPREINPQLPEELSSLILRCLEKDKAKRYQSAEELHSELNALEEEIPTTERAIPKRKTAKSKKITTGEGKIKWTRIALIGAAVVVLALIVYAGLRLFVGRSGVIDSIAVLPFENVNADPNTDYLCDGITETIINKLLQLSNFKTVICRNSVFAYKGKAVNPKKVGQELGVKAILLTRLVRMGDRLTISPTLVRTKDNSQLWGERYDRKFEDILSVEENIAASIVQALRLKMTKRDQQRISERSIDNAAAYECYLRANFEIWRYRTDSLDRAVKDLQDALDIAGPNALLYSAMAEAYTQYVNIGAKQEDYLEKAEEYAKKALALDPNFSKANVVLGYLNWYTNLHEAIRCFKKALAVNPNELYALRSLVSIYNQIGKPSAALPLVERYQKTDPLNPDNYLLRGDCYFFNGQLGFALDEFRKWYQSDPSNPVKEYFYVLMLAYNEAFDEAFSIIDQSAKTTPDNVVTQAGLLLKYGLLKDKGKAFQLLTPDLQKTCQRDLEWSYYIAGAFALLDEKKEALDWLENAVNRGFINYPFINKHDPFLANIRGEERFKKLMERVQYEWEHFEE